MSKKVFIAGAGGIGRAAGLILAESAMADYQVTLGDINKTSLGEAVDFINSGNTKGKTAEGHMMSTDGDDAVLAKYLEDCTVLLDCLPGSQAPRMARLAKETGCHYANLTEYVAETNAIMDIAKDAETGFVLQTGLAPGFINVLAMQLVEDFKHQHQVDQVQKVSMKVGALSQHVSAPHFYAFTWSPVGVATEYIKDAVVVKDGKTISIPALSGVETHVIDGVAYEDNFTSGGAADLPEALSGIASDLEYKTLRYPGHYQWVQDQIAELGSDDIAGLQNRMLDHIPMVENDVVIVYASVKGLDQYGTLRMIDKAYKVLPSKVGNQTLRAIQTTTAAPLCEMAHQLAQGQYEGLVLQSQIDTQGFLNGAFVQPIYGGY